MKLHIKLSELLARAWRGRLPCGRGAALLTGCALAASAMTGAAQAASGLQAAHLAQAVALAREAALALAPAGARIEVTAGAPDPRLRLAPCAQVQAHQAAGSLPWGRTRVGLRCVRGTTLWNVYVPVTVAVHAPAWVASGALPAGVALGSQHLQQAMVDWAAESSPPFSSLHALSGRSLAQPVAPGQPVREAQLQVRRWFRVGQTVEVVAVGDGFSVSASGRALSDGIAGRPARVRTEAGRVLVGRPTAEGRLEIRL